MGGPPRTCARCGSCIVRGKCDCEDKDWPLYRACANCGVYQSAPEECKCRTPRRLLEPKSPAWHGVQSAAPVFGGKWRYHVLMNGGCRIETYDTWEEAELRAAALNYQQDCYRINGIIGMDGVN